MVAAAPVVTRDVRPEDRSGLQAFMAALTAFEGRFETDRDSELARNAGHFDRIVEEIARQRGFILVAEVGGRLAGYLSVLFDDYGAYLKEDLRRHAYITDMFIAERHRGSGIGVRLKAEAENRARAAGLKRMTVGALTGNALANVPELRLPLLRGSVH